MKDKSSQGIVLDEKSQEQPTDKDRAQKVHKSRTGSYAASNTRKQGRRDSAFEGEERLLGSRRLETSSPPYKSASDYARHASGFFVSPAPRFVGALRRFRLEQASLMLVMTGTKRLNSDVSGRRSDCSPHASRGPAGAYYRTSIRY